MPVTRVLWAATVGALWPVVVVGIAQLAVVCFVLRRLRSMRIRRLDQPVAMEVETLPVQR